MFNSRRRYENESIRGAWIRSRKIWPDAKSSGVDIADKMKFIRCLKALNLTDDPRISALSTSRSKKPHFPVSWKDLAAECPAPIFKIEKPEDLLSKDAAKCGVAIGGEDLTPTYLTQSKTRNRHGVDKASARYSAKNMEIPTGAQDYAPHDGQSINRAKGGSKGKTQ